MNAIGSPLLASENLENLPKERTSLTRGFPAKDSKLNFRHRVAREIIGNHSCYFVTTFELHYCSCWTTSCLSSAISNNLLDARADLERGTTFERGARSKGESHSKGELVRKRESLGL